MNKKNLRITLIAIVATATLTGCGGNSAFSSADSTAAVEQTDTQEENNMEAENSAEMEESDASGTSFSEAKEIVSYGGCSVNARLQNSDSCVGDGDIYYAVSSTNSKDGSVLCSVSVEGGEVQELVRLSGYTSISNLNYYNGSVYYTICYNYNEGDDVTELRCYNGSEDILIEEFEGAVSVVQNFNDDLFYVNQRSEEVEAGVFNLLTDEQTVLDVSTAYDGDVYVDDIIDTDGTYIYFYLINNSGDGWQPYRLLWDAIYDKDASLEVININEETTSKFQYTPIFSEDGLYVCWRKDINKIDYLHFDYADITTDENGTLSWSATTILEDLNNDSASSEETLIETLYFHSTFMTILEGHTISLSSDWLFYSDSLDYRLSSTVNESLKDGVDADYSDYCEYGNAVYYFFISGSEGTVFQIDSSGNVR